VKGTDPCTELDSGGFDAQAERIDRSQFDWFESDDRGSVPVCPDRVLRIDRQATRLHRRAVIWVLSAVCVAVVASASLWGFFGSGGRESARSRAHVVARPSQQPLRRPQSRKRRRGAARRRPMTAKRQPETQQTRLHPAAQRPVRIDGRPSGEQRVGDRRAEREFGFEGR
jgi:hypothetical protein